MDSCSQESYLMFWMRGGEKEGEKCGIINCFGVRLGRHEYGGVCCLLPEGECVVPRGGGGKFAKNEGSPIFYYLGKNIKIKVNFHSKISPADTASPSSHLLNPNRLCPSCMI